MKRKIPKGFGPKFYTSNPMESDVTAFMNHTKRCSELSHKACGGLSQPFPKLRLVPCFFLCLTLKLKLDLLCRVMAAFRAGC